MALRVVDVGFLRREVHIVYQFAPGTRVRSEPKTPSSKRTIPLPQVVADAIALHLTEFESDADGTIFTTRYGAPHSHSCYGTTVFHAAVKKAGLPETTTTHALRHAYASWLIEAGESVVTVAERLGHDNATQVIKVYAHMMHGTKERTRKAIDSA